MKTPTDHEFAAAARAPEAKRALLERLRKKRKQHEGLSKLLFATIAIILAFCIYFSQSSPSSQKLVLLVLAAFCFLVNAGMLHSVETRRRHYDAMIKSLILTGPELDAIPDGQEDPQSHASLGTP